MKDRNLQMNIINCSSPLLYLNNMNQPIINSYESLNELSNRVIYSLIYLPKVNKTSGSKQAPTGSGVHSVVANNMKILDNYHQFFTLLKWLSPPFAGWTQFHVYHRLETRVKHSFFYFLRKSQWQLRQSRYNFSQLFKMEIVVGVFKIAWA